MLKKILSAVICVALLASVFPANFALGAENADRGTELVDFLTSLGIYGSNDNMIYGNDLITREDLASILSVFYGFTEESYPTETGISDVVADWAAGHIMTMVNMGILTKYSDGLFRPKDNVTKASLCKVFITMTGYDFFAEADGGYPNGYVNRARKLGILDGVDVSDPNEFVEKHELTQMLYNTLSVPLLEMASVGDSYEYEKNEDITLLTKNLDIYKAEGLVTSLPYVSLNYGNGAGEGKAIVGDTIYNAELDLYDYLGCECEIYFRQGEDEGYGTILYAQGIDSGNRVTEVPAEDILSFQGKTFRYYDGTKVKEIKLPTDFMLIFNGKRLTNYKQYHLLPPQGKVRFCDTDGNRIFDKVIVDYEVNYRVASVAVKEDAVYITDADYKDGLVIGTDDGYWCEVFKKGQKCAPKDIKAGDVLSIVADDIDIAQGSVKKTSRVYRINVSDIHFSGTVTSLDSEGIYVDDVFYELTDELFEDVESISLGRDYIFYLNHLGKIASYDEGAVTLRYGLLIDYADNVNGFDDISMVRIFTSDGKFIDYDCTDRLTLDGKAKKYIDNFGKLLQRSAVQCQKLINDDLASDLDFENTSSAYTSYWQVIKYEVSESGRLLSIDTVADNVRKTDNDLKYFGATDSDFSWVSPVIAVNSSVASSSGKKQERYTLKDGAVLIGMEKAPTDEKHFVTYSTSVMHQNEYIASYGATSGAQRNIACILFDADDMDLCSFMLVAENGIATKVNAYVGGTNLIVFERLSQKVHTDGEVYTTICGTNVTNGSIVQLPIEDVSSIAAAKPGDWLRYSTDAEGVVYAIKIWLSRTDSTLGDGTTATYLWRGRWGGSTRISYARVEAKTDTHIMLRYDDEPGAFDLSNNYVGTEDEVNTFTETLKFPSSAKYFIFDTRTNKTIPASKSDLRDMRSFGEDADLVGIRAVNATINAIVIYR